MKIFANVRNFIKPKNAKISFKQAIKLQNIYFVTKINHKEEFNFIYIFDDLDLADKKAKTLGGNVYKVAQLDELLKKLPFDNFPTIIQMALGKASLYNVDVSDMRR